MASKEREFFNACAVGDLARVQSLSTQVDVNWGNPYWIQRTGLHEACREGKGDIVRYLLTLPQIDVSIRDADGNTPLFLACWNGEEAIVKMFAGDQRIDVNITEDRYGATLLWMACHFGEEGVAKILLASGRADVTKRTKESCFSPNTTAADVARIEGYPKIADLIDEYERNPREVAQRLRRELDWPTADRELAFTSSARSFQN